MSDNELIVLDRQGIEDLLTAHRLWVESHSKEGRFPDFGYMVLREMDASGIDMMEAQFHDSRLERCRFIGTDLAASAIRRTVAVDCDFSRAVLPKSTISRSDLRGCRFDAANLIRVYLHAADLRGTSFRGTDLRGATFINCDLRGAVFDGADLESASFTNCIVDGASWVGAAPPPVFETDPRMAR